MADNTPKEQYAAALKAMKRPKYGNVPVEVDGVRYASKKEARRGAELRLMLRAGEIRFLLNQPKYPILINGVRVCNVIPDFSYLRTVDDAPVVEDVKSAATRKNPVYRLKKRMFESYYGLKLVEV